MSSIKYTILQLISKKSADIVYIQWIDVECGFG